MQSGFVGQFANLIGSPYGIGLIIIGLLVVFQAKNSPRLSWFVFTLFGFAASLAKFQDQWVEEAPALVFPLQQIRDMGRPLTIVFLGLLIVIALQKQGGWRSILIPKPLRFLILVQLAIFFKTLAYGNFVYAIIAAFTFGALVFMFRVGPARWLQDEENFSLAAWAIAMVGIIFIVLNAYQAYFDLYAITFVHGSLLGTTGNPHHAAVLLVATIPSFMFLIESRKQWDWVKVFLMMNLTLTLIALYLTSSRTGMIMGTVSIIFFYRKNGAALLRMGLGVGVLSAIILPRFLSEEGGYWGNPFVSSTDKFLSGTDTRSAVWQALWNQFSKYPLFGAPLEGDRLGFGESSWLAAGATVGLIGLIPLIIFGLACIKMIFELNSISNKKPDYFLQTSMVSAGLASLLAGSFTEAFLLGNISFSLIALLIYLCLGEYLIELDRVQDAYLSSWYQRFYHHQIN